MKISKLFHWLYAILMLLPVAMFIPTAFYYGFNEQAQAQERININQNYYEKSIISYGYEYDELEINTLYTFKYFETDENSELIYFDYCMALFTDDEEVNETDYYALQTFQDGNFTIYTPGNTYYLQTGDISTTSFIFAVNDVQLTNLVTNFEVPIFQNYEIYGCDLLIPNGENTTTTYTMSITDSMSTAWTNTWSNPLFSWSANGFLIAPFNYITELFGMPNNSTFTLALNYWLTISIVYLVFDLVMYVPLLAHRWIDKGMVE